MAARGDGRAIARTWPFALLVLLLTLVLLPATAGLGKDLELTGTADCGLRSGARCTIGDTLRLWTTDVDGTRRLVEIDVSWIRDQLGGIDQDDLLSFEVRDLGDYRFQAIAIHDEQPPPPKPTVEDEHENGGALPATATPTPTLTPTTASTATSTATSTPTGTLTPTTTSTATATATSTSTATPTFTPTPVADLVVTKIDDSSSRCQNDFTCWTVTITNSGPDTATNVTVQEIPPPGPAFDTVNPSPGTTYDPTTNVWTIGTLGSGASATLQIAVGHFGATQANCAEVLHSDQFDPNSTSNRACSTHANPV